ncbi:unnamed protein product [Candida verbasci]|uniref:Major facilitator superfamily (MFS) profile domain-containing protein n=1 Tax=Candida verbasci TaxID=1227364 RepID=A0A9W4U213_9ASCO|nr:unnamed protein product [Candida verbasci]
MSNNNNNNNNNSTTPSTHDHDLDTTSLASSNVSHHQHDNPVYIHHDDDDESYHTNFSKELHPDPVLGPLADLEKDISSIDSNKDDQIDLENQPQIIPSSLSKKSITSIKSLKVKRKDKRGLLASLVVIPEYYDARDYPIKIKYIIVTIIALASVTGPMGTSIMLPAIDDIVAKLHTSNSMVNVSVGVYMLALGIFPMWWSSFSERFGRRSVYLISFVLFVAFSIGTSLSPNIAALIILRVLQGGCSASVQAVGAGTIADLFVPKERGVAMGWYYLGPLMGPFLAPILGGAVAQAWGWRATQWLLMIFSACNLISMTFFLPETLRRADNLQILMNQNNKIEKIISRRSNMSQEEKEEEDQVPVMDPVMPTMSRVTTNQSAYSRRITQEYEKGELKKTLSNISKKSEHNKFESFKTNLYDIFIRPLHSVVLLTYPPVILVITFSGLSFAAIYFFNMTISYEYARSPYNFSEIIVGLMYIPNSVTYLIASIIGGKWNDRLINKYAEKHGELIPEARLSWNLVIAVILYPMACLIFGWTIKYGEFWVIPLIGSAICGFASMLVIGTTVTYLVDILPGKGATGVALNNLIRQILGAVATFIVEPLLNAIGAGILFSIIAGYLIVASSVLLYLKKRGFYYREHYDIMKFYEKL